MIKKHIKKRAVFFLFEIIFILGVFAYVFFTTTPAQIYPISGMVISENDFVFEIENGEEILISANENFSNLIILREGDDIVLPPGTYFWKVQKGFRESEVKNFTILTTVGLDIKEKEENYELKNSGNVNLNVTEKDNLISGFVIHVGEAVEVEKNNSTYEGRQYD